MEKRIVYNTDDGRAIVIVPVDSRLAESIAAKTVPAGKSYKIINADELPVDMTFYNAWKYGDSITVDLARAKEIAHIKRRAAREMEFAPFDAIIAKQIPGENLIAAESARAAIRNKYATIQSNIDSATSISEIVTAMSAFTQ